MVKKNAREYCSSIGEEEYNKAGSCIAPKVLNKLVKNEVVITNDKLSKLSSIKKINLLKNKLNNKQNDIKCNIDKEGCIIKTLNPEIYKKYYKPIMPESWNDNPHSWLSNIDINNVLSQYEQDPKNNFKLLDVSPINYDDKISSFFSSECVSQNLCNINKESVSNFIKRKQWKLGIVFNTDRYGNPGKHWICIFANINPKSKNYGIYYFDSNAVFKSEYINKILKQLKTLTEELTKKKIKVYRNTVKVQKTTNSECGMFCLYMIINMMKNKSFEKLLKDDLTDNLVFKHREIFFNKL